MIPGFNHSGVLPPYLGLTPAAPGAMSPYSATIGEFAQRFDTSAHRRNLLKNLIRYRLALRSIGLTNGFQWLDGSFAEDVETTRARPPGDIDVVTFAHRPVTHSSDAAWNPLWQRHIALFDPVLTKRSYQCDAYYVDLGYDAEGIAEQSAYWFGLFTHQKYTDAWKGLVKVPLSSNDRATLALLP